MDVMIFGMSLETFTLVHTVISLVGIGSGLIVLFGMIAGKRLDRWTALFLVSDERIRVRLPIQS
jgi:hypothetical protein